MGRLAIRLQQCQAALIAGKSSTAEPRRALEQFEGSAHDVFAHNETEEYEIQTRKTLIMNEEALGAGHKVDSLPLSQSSFACLY